MLDEGAVTGRTKAQVQGMELLCVLGSEAADNVECSLPATESGKVSSVSRAGGGGGEQRLPEAAAAPRLSVFSCLGC